MKNLSKFFYLTVIMVMLAGLVFQVTPARASTLAEIETSIDNGLAYLAGIQNVDGSWSGEFPVGITCAAVSKFQDRAYEKGYTSPFDPAYTYSDEITLAYQYIFANAHQQTPLAVQTYGDPDTNANGYGVWFASPSSAPNYSEVNYETGLCLMAMHSSMLPDHPNEGSLDFNGDTNPDTFAELTQEGVDFLAWSQNETGANRGGWRYGFNPQDSDTSVSGFVTLGLAYAESFGATIPAFVKTELNNWITYSQCADGGAGYTACGASNSYRTGHLVTMMSFVGDTPATPRMDNALKYIEANWALPLPEGTGFLGTWSLMKGLSYSGVHLLDLDGDTVRDEDWYNEDPGTSYDLATYIIGLQQVDGGWGAGSFYEGNSAALKAAFALLVLEKASPPPPNTPPVAVDDSYSTHHGTTLAGSTVFVNDTDADGDPLISVEYTAASHASAFDLYVDGTFSYTPVTGFVGQDTFTYRVNDGKAFSNWATVTIDVTNTAPVAVDDTYATKMSVAFNGATVLANDTDADGDPLTAVIVANPAHASAFTFNADGTFTYEPENGYQGADTFTYMANDGAENSNVATVTINITPLIKRLYSIASDDGWIMKRANNTWWIWEPGPALRMGDQMDQQYRSFISFNTTKALPANYVIVNTTVRLYKTDIIGGDPFLTHGKLLADIRKGFFGTLRTLDDRDFLSSGTHNSIGSVVAQPAPGWYALILPPANYGDLNLVSGLTQFRLRFAKADNGNGATDYVQFCSGNCTATKKPQLVIEYYIPHP